jgi:sodium transport system permease protein
MSPRNILVVYRKELRDLLRDRRTLRAMVFMPLIMMPVMIQGFGRAVRAASARARAGTPIVQILGAEGSPQALAWLQGDPKLKIVPATADWRQLIADKKIQAAVQIPEAFEAGLEAGQTQAITIFDYDGELRSGTATGELEDRLRKRNDAVLRQRLEEHGLPAALARPLVTRRENVAQPERVAGNRLGGLIPYFIIILSFVGAMYPALDLTAGEKERGTMETLLCTPVARTEIVLGKFLMVLTCSLCSIVLACVSLLLSFQWLGFQGQAGAADLGLTNVNPVGALGVLVMVLPVSVLFSSVLLTIGLWARSHREGTSYVQPLIAVVLLTAMIGLLPGIDLNARFALVPILNLSLACREMLSGVWHWHYLALIFASMSFYAALALALAVRMFNRESVLFRT